MKDQYKTPLHNINCVAILSVPQFNNSTQYILKWEQVIELNKRNNFGG